MFIDIEELRSAIYNYQVDEITEGDDSICQMAIAAAVEEMKSYLRASYDVAAIFGATGNQRNALLMELCKDIAVWHITRLSNPDMIFENVKERYDRATDWFNRVSAGKIAPELPLLKDDAGNTSLKLKFGSHEKFGHHF